MPPLLPALLAACAPAAELQLAVPATEGKSAVLSLWRLSLCIPETPSYLMFCMTLLPLNASLHHVTDLLQNAFVHEPRRCDEELCLTS